jgi:TusA-related sulfurtransferase
MTDRYDHDLLLGYLEGDLDADRRAQVEQVLAEDPQLAALMKGLERDRAMLRALPTEQAPDDLSHDLVQGLERRMLLDAPQVDAGGPIPIQRGAGLAPTATGFPWSRAIGVGSLAAAVALATGLVFYVNNSGSLPRTALDLSQSPAPTEPGGTADEANAPAGLHSGSAAADGDSTHRGQPGGAEATRGTNGITNTDPPPRVADSNADPRSRVERARDALLGSANPLPPNPGSPAALARDTAPPADPALAGEEWPLGQTLLAFAALSPNQALRVESDNPDETRRQILDWCIDNSIPVVEQQFAQGTAYGDSNTDEPYALLIDEDQLDALVTRMNQAELAPARRQRAAIDTPVNAYNQQQRSNVLNPVQPDADDAGAAQAALVDNELPQVVGLKVPEDLGDEALTQQNLANTFAYSNNEDLARTAQRNAEVLRNQRRDDPGVSMAEAGESPADPGGEAFLDAQQEQGPGGRSADDNAPGRAGGLDGGRAGSRAAPSRGASRAGHSADDDQPADTEDQTLTEPEGDVVAEASEAQRGGRDDAAPAEDVELLEAAESADQADAGEPTDERATRTPAPRGNWLMPQVPLAPTTPLWTDPPAARLVPIVIIPQAAQDPDTAAADGPAAPGTAEPEADEDADSAPADAAPPSEPAPGPDADE